jgi:hypothetical protein
MKINLKKGIDNLEFGLTRPEVEEIIGRPVREITNPEDDNELIWEYADQKLRLTFYQKEDNRLGYIRSSNSSLTIFDMDLIDCKIEEVKNRIDPRTESWEKEEYFSFTTYFHESNWLTLNVEYDRITDIELGVPFKNEDEYDWPTLK